MAKRKSDPERAARDAQVEARLRRLRELEERGWAELEARAAAEGRPFRRPTLAELEERGWAALGARPPRGGPA